MRPSGHAHPRRPSHDRPRGGGARSVSEPRSGTPRRPARSRSGGSGARAPIIWSVPPPDIEPADACRELARRHLHVFGPTTAAGFARWAGISAARGCRRVRLAGGIPRARPITARRRVAARRRRARHARPAAARRQPARLLPSGDAYFLLDGAERELLVPRAEQRELLWTSRVWPGALLVDGEIRGTWRRAKHTVRIDAWEAPSRGATARRSRPRRARCSAPEAIENVELDRR